MDVAEYVASSLSEAVKYATGSERLRAAMGSLEVPLKGLKDVIDVEPDLGPEIGAAVDSLESALAAIGRASDFLSARYDTIQQRLHQAVSES